MPCFLNSGTSALTVSTSSRKVSPATPVGTTMVGVSFSVRPMKATGMPWKRLT
jgi:hypothetical protein